MMAATVFFFFEMGNVQDKWRTSLLVSGLITFIAAVHYYYMRDFWLENGTSPTELRYIDWILTVPLMCVEFYLILKSFGAKIGLLWKMIFYSVWMLLAGFLGETVFRESSAIWGAISTLGYLGIFYEVWFGSANQGIAFGLVGGFGYKFFLGDPGMQQIEDYYKENPTR